MSAGTAALAASDPTGTEGKRSKATATFNAKWRELRGRIRNEIQTNDRLKPGSNRSQARKVSEFRHWLEQEIDDTVVEPHPPGSVIAGNHFSGPIVRDAHLHGILLGNAHLRRAGADVDPLSYNDAEILVRTQRHQEFIEREYEAIYDDIVDAGKQTHTDVSRTYRDKLAAGVGISALLTGRNQTDEGLNDRVDAVGQTSTKRTAHGRVVQTVNEGALLYYEGEGVDQVAAIPELSVEVSSEEGKSEWTTQGDSAVCDQCRSLAQKTYTTSEILQGNSPLPVRDTHPFCRCYLEPII